MFQTPYFNLVSFVNLKFSCDCFLSTTTWAAFLMLFLLICPLLWHDLISRQVPSVFSLLSMYKSLTWSLRSSLKYLSRFRISPGASRSALTSLLCTLYSHPSALLPGVLDIKRYGTLLWFLVLSAIYFFLMQLAVVFHLWTRALL